MFECEDLGLHRGEKRPATIANFHQHEGEHHTELWCADCARKATGEEFGPYLICDRYEPLVIPVLGDEMSVCIEAFCVQLAHYVRHMPLLLGR